MQTSFSLFMRRTLHLELRPSDEGVEASKYGADAFLVWNIA